MRYLVEDFREDKNNPKITILDKGEMFELLQTRPDGIAITEISNICIIDWS